MVEGGLQRSSLPLAFIIMKTVIVKNQSTEMRFPGLNLYPELLMSVDQLLTKGWGNGYVIVDPSNILFGMTPHEIYKINPELTVHGGITGSGPVNNFFYLREECSPLQQEWWVFGFDTMHPGDNEHNCPMEYVQAQADLLLTQLEEIIITLNQVKNKLIS